MITEHYPTDVPRLTQIVDPPKYKGEIIIGVKVNPSEESTTIFLRSGKQFNHPNHITVRVEHGPERQAKMEWARNLLNG